MPETYDYKGPEAPWYSEPVRLGRPVWSDPYVDEGGSEARMVTYSIPVYVDERRRLLGVVTSDLRLK